ncbi:hypothetical protein [Flavobacterium sp.]|uniref:hypothetical protein n=1 Tax=Flavobacterium sp. TaxID=239 RepID=UPI00286B887E|nr:hypothetical protein [Flavobacterium sp.]
MKKKIKISTITLSLLLLTSCGFKLKVIPGEHFTKQTTLSIGNYDDAIGTVKELTYLLKLEGFNVISPSSASNAVNYKDPFNDISKNKELQKIFSISDLNSIYSIKLDYHYSKDKKGYTNFYLSVIDPNGRVIMYGHFMNEMIGQHSLLKKVAKKLAQQIK